MTLSCSAARCRCRHRPSSGSRPLPEAMWNRSPSPTSPLPLALRSVRMRGTRLPGASEYTRAPGRRFVSRDKTEDSWEPAVQLDPTHQTPLGEIHEDDCIDRNSVAWIQVCSSAE